MNSAQFIATYRQANLSERSVAQQHFLHLCDLLGHPHPVAQDPTGEHFTFEKAVTKNSGGKGFADVWKKGCFGWEYKGKHKDLKAAYGQLLQYREALENPPLLIVSDIERIILHTNFTNTPHKETELLLEDFDKPEVLATLRAAFFDPNCLKPGITRETITKDAAIRLAQIAESLRKRGLEARAVAHFLDRIIFCLFAEDIELLPAGLFSRLVENTRQDAPRFSRQIKTLFEAMAHGGDFGAEIIRHFNGNLFDDASALDLTREEIEAVRQAAKLDWSAVDPSILGTLFERGLDPDKRSQLGAHYTRRDDIETLIEPVVLQPLRREWEEAKSKVEQALNRKTRQGTAEADRLLHGFLTRLGRVTVLDPACGSGNFLFVTLQKLKDLEKSVIDFAFANGFSGFFPEVGPWQLYGIEKNPYAADLAQMTVWIGYLQWLREHGYLVTDDPVLRSTQNIQCRDAVLDQSDPDTPKEPDWPETEFIVGNPPFKGGQFLRKELGDGYVDALFQVWKDQVRPESDLCCYWFEKARTMIAAEKCQRAGLLATQGIRGGANREVLKRIKESGDIFFAVSDRDWILDGANVHVSMVGFDDASEQSRYLDNSSVSAIHSNLTGQADITTAGILRANVNVCFRASEKGGSFELLDEIAVPMLRSPNVHGKPNSDVIRPWMNSFIMLQQRANYWIVDYTCNEEDEAALYEQPFNYIVEPVQKERLNNREPRLQKFWWLHRRNAVNMRQAIASLERFLITPRVSKHRIFVWMHPPLLPDNMLSVFARSDDYFFGVLHSRIHEVWGRAQGTQLREKESGFRYTPTTCFETFPFPEPTTVQREAIAEAARQIDTLRNKWLNPPEWTREEVLEFPAAVDGPWARYVQNADSRGIGIARYPRMAAKDPTAAAELAKRTLTNLYNQRPTWLDRAHKRLDEAVGAAYGWPADLSEEAILEGLLKLNLERSLPPA